MKIHSTLSAVLFLLLPLETLSQPIIRDVINASRNPYKGHSCIKSSCIALDRIVIESAEGIEWLRISGFIPDSPPYSYYLPERWYNVFYDGPVYPGLEITAPKFPPESGNHWQSESWNLVREWSIYAWGKGQLRYTAHTLPYSRFGYEPGGVFIEHGEAVLVLSANSVQAGDLVSLNLQIPPNLVHHVGEIRLLYPAGYSLPDGSTPLETQTDRGTGFSNYFYSWSVPEAWNVRNLIGGKQQGITFEIYANKKDRNGQYPQIAAGATTFTIVSPLDHRLVVQGVHVQSGQQITWNNVYPKSISVSPEGGQEPFTYEWMVDSERPDHRLIQENAYGSKLEDERILSAANSISVTIRDANGHQTTAIAYLSPPELDISLFGFGQLLAEGQEVEYKTTSNTNLRAVIRGGQKPFNVTWDIDGLSFTGVTSPENPTIHDFNNQTAMADARSLRVHVRDARGNTAARNIRLKNTVLGKELKPVINISGNELWTNHWVVTQSALKIYRGTDFGFYHNPQDNGDAHPNPGRTGVLYLHPVNSGTPAIVERIVQLGPAPRLRMGVSGNINPTGDWSLLIKVNDAPVGGQHRIDGSAGWQDVAFDLSAYANQTVLITIEAHPSDWYFEYVFIDYIELN